MNWKTFFDRFNPNIIKDLIKFRFYAFPFFTFPAKKYMFKVNNSSVEYVQS